MDILIVSFAFQPAWDWGGPVRSMWNLARGLVRRGEKVVVVATNATQAGVLSVPHTRIEEGVEIIACPILGNGRLKHANRFGVSPSFWGEIASRTRHADVVHIDGFWGAGPTVAALACTVLKKPYLVSTRGNLQQDALCDKSIKKRAALNLGVRTLLSNACALHYTTQLEKDASPTWARHLESFIVPNPVEVKPTEDGAQFRAELGIGPECLLLGSIGRVHRRKGFEVIAEALRRLKPRDIIWAVVGPDDGYLASLSILINDFDLASSVRIVGERTGVQLEQVYAGIDVLVLPSHGENFGNVVVEAALQGTPSFVSDRLGLMSWVAERNTGCVLPMESEVWADALGSVTRRDVALRWDAKRLVAAAVETFAIDSVANDMIRHYTAATTRCAG